MGQIEALFSLARGTVCRRCGADIHDTGLRRYGQTCIRLRHLHYRTYQCLCGFHTHRDRVGAINIMRQPGADGNSLSA
ncbi:zinc ribbon domain-containing protein [Paenibacillus profundus]|uniref:Zinc ribbon domain-containing protein n=1 Tax=Paenibacillus profundus TaxID=1173085 RepID=A0ABS8YIW5_9BACL|nr:zinc ribbon domain-containing protein [Paenibacillus profundus]